MGRTKHGMPPRSKSEREFDHEIGNIVFVLNAIDAGRLDHVFVDAETKAAVRADWMAKAEAVVRKVRQRKPRSLKRTRLIWRENELNSQTQLGCYPTAQIRQGGGSHKRPTRQGWGRRAGTCHDALGGRGAS